MTLPLRSDVDRPRVSVCVPVYNGSAFIAETLRSILAQTFRDFELLVLDNSSTDDTLDVVARFADPRLRTIVNDKNLGAVGNFNRALLEARGDRIKIVCADDLLLPDCLERQVRALDAAPGAVFACCARQVIDPDGKAWMRRGFPGRRGRIRSADAVAAAIRSGTNPFGEPMAVLMDRLVAVRAGGFSADWKFCVDLDLWCRLLDFGDAVVLPEALCCFRIRPDAWSATIRREQASEFGRFVACATERHAGAVSRFDATVGRWRAKAFAVLRRIFYYYAFRSIHRTG